MKTFPLPKKFRQDMEQAVLDVGGITRASRLTGIHERVLRRAMRDESKRFKQQSVQLFHDALEDLKSMRAQRMLTPEQRRRLNRAVNSVGGFRAAARIAPLSDRCLRKAAGDTEATFRPTTIQDIERTIEILTNAEGDSNQVGESKLDRIERKLDLIINHLGLEAK